MRVPVIIAAAVAATLIIGSTAVARAPDTWDNLYKVKAKRADAVYLLPGADFRGYTKIMLDPVQVAFQKNWQRDYNRNQTGGSRDISDADVAKALTEVRDGFQEILAKALTEGGYKIVTMPGADVLRLGSAVINIKVIAPDTMSSGRSRTYSSEAGQATLVVELRDSQSNAVLGRAVDAQAIGDMGTLRMGRTSSSNRADFAQAFERWAKTSVQGLETLKSNSPMQIPAK